MKPIEVFYHFYIPADLRACTWPWWADAQLSLIRKSNLAANAKIKMAVTMPADWEILNGAWFAKEGVDYSQWTVPDEQRLNFEGKFREYIAARYPFVEIIEVRNTIETNIYEGQTLKLMHNRSFENDDLHLLYISNKGMSGTSTSPATLNWLELLNYFYIEKWVECVEKLKDYDIVALKDNCSYPTVLSGNFFWANSSYIKTLPEPLDSKVYTQGRFIDTGPGEKSYRYAFEHWPVCNKPKVFEVYSNTDHYTTYFFPEQHLDRLRY